MRSSPGLPSCAVAGAAVGAGCARVPLVSPGGFLEEFPVLRCLPCRVVRTLLLCPCTFQLIVAFGCCLWSRAYWIFREILRAPHLVRQWIHVLRGLWKNLHIFYVAVNSNPEPFALHSCRMEKCAQSMLLVAASLSAVRTLEVDIISTNAPFFDSLWQFSLLIAAFFGALDDEELFIIEGSCQLDRSVVWTHIASSLTRVNTNTNNQQHTTHNNTQQQTTTRRLTQSCPLVCACLFKSNPSG